MPIYKYSAKNEYGESVKGKVEARNKSHAASALIGRNLLVIDIAPITETSLSYLQGKLVGVKADDLVNFTRQLATMSGAGLPLSTSLSILQDQSSPAMSAVIAKVLQDVEGGSTLAKALKEHPDVFTRVYIQLVRAGEIGGILENVLERLADTLEKQKDFSAKTKGAMIYPVIVLIAMVVVAFIMMVFVMPQLTEMYRDFGAELPLTTRALIAISDFMVKFWWVFIGGAVALFLGLRTWSKTEPGEKFLDEVLFKIPIIGSLRTKLVLTEFARTLSLLIHAGVSLLEAMDIVGSAMNSYAFRQAMLDAKDEVEKGVPMSTALGVYEIFPAILPQMLSVGEETGKMDEILLKLSEYYEKESEYAVKNLTAVMEPVIMIILGVGVGFMVVSIMMPIYSLTTQF